MPWDLFMLTLRVFWRRMGLFLTANLLWLAMSLLVVTWPAATAGLFHLARRVVEEELAADPRQAVIADFWEGFRQHWRRATLLTLIDLAALAVIAVSLRFYGEGTIAELGWLVGPITLVGLAWAGAQLYLFPLLLHRDDRSPLAVAREAFLMAISYPLLTLTLMLLTLVLAAGATILAGPILLLFFALMALIQTMMLRTLLAQRGELALTMTPEQREARERMHKK